MEISEISVGRGNVCGQRSWGGWEGDQNKRRQHRATEHSWLDK